MPRQRDMQTSRLACNRCHYQKLRCQRQEGQGSCLRCSQSNSACVYSPRQRRTVRARPQLSSSISQGHAQDEQLEVNTLDIIDNSNSIMIAAQQDPNNQLSQATDLTTPQSVMDFSIGNDGPSSDLMFGDWSGLPSLGFHYPELASSHAVWDCSVDSAPSAEDIGRMPWPRDAVGQVDDIHNSTLYNTTRRATAVTESSETSSLRYIRQLADLNVRLYEHANKLPPLGIKPSDRIPSLDGRVFAIDETFRMTQSLIDILKSLYSSTGPPPDFVPDQSTVLLILSSSNRVFDIHEVIFGHMRGCIQHKITPVTSDGKTLLLPQLRIGSFAPPMSSAIAMQMLLIVIMASELFDQLQDVLGVWQRSKSSSSRTSGPVQGSHGHFEEIEQTVGMRSPFPDFTEEAKSEMCRRAICLAEEIASTRQLLLNMPDMHGSGSLQRHFMSKS